MKTKLTEFEAKKQELNCGINVVPILNYLEDIYNYEKMYEIVEPLGLPIDFLINKRNWVSYEYYTALIEKLVEFTGDEKAPFKVSFTTKPQSVFLDIYYATYATVFLGSPKYIYKLIFHPKVYTRFTKIGDFKVLKLTNTSAIIQYKLKKQFKQNIYNCLAIQGYLTLGTVSCGLPPAKVEHTECAAKGHDSCIYKVSWEAKKNIFKIIFPILLFFNIAIEIFFFNKVFNIKDIIITFLTYSTIYLIIQSYQYFKKIQHAEVYNYERNNSIIEAMEKIEHDYTEILNTKIKLEERNRYLSIINEINRSITESMHFDILLITVAKILINEIKFTEGIYFQFNFKEKKFMSSFEFEYDKKKKHINGPINIFNNLIVTHKSYNIMKDLGFSFALNDCKKNKDFDSKDLTEWMGKNTGSYYILPIEIPNILYLGFFLFKSNKEINMSGELINDLFNSIANQLKIGYEKISSRYVIENILSSIPSSVLIFDIDNFQVKYVNDMFVNVFSKANHKKRDSEIIDADLFKILPFDKKSRSNLVKTLENMLTNKISEPFEFNMGTNVFEYSLFNIPQFGHEQRLVGIILNDVTEAKYFQQKLILNEKLLALGRVASGIAHEINNPLYAVLANAEEIAEDENLEEETRNYAEEMIEHVMNVSNIIRDLSSYSKTLRKEKNDELDINSVINESLKLVKYSSNFLEIEVETSLTPLPPINAAKGEIQQIFINLFNNAIQAMEGKGILRIKSEFVNNEINITISDTGCGIKKEIISHIFDLYFTTKSAGEGTGQGLHIVKKIIDMYNGKIEVKSEVGNGTTFLIKFKVNKKIKV